MRKIKWLIVVMVTLLMVSCGETPLIIRIHFETNNGTSIQTMYYQEKQEIDLPDYLTKEGYIFSGWFIDDDTFQTELTQTNILTYQKDRNITVYAKWEELEYTINYHLEDGIENPNLTTFYSDTLVVELENPEKEGYSFYGWYDNPECDGYITTQIVLGEETVIDLYPKWEINFYSINLNTNGGEGVQKIRQAYLLVVNRPTDPIREGYTFDTWYEDEALTVPYIFDVMQAESTTIYAGWIVNQYTILFETNGSTEIEAYECEYDHTIDLPEEPLREGYSFAGWFLDRSFSRPFTYQTMPARNLMLYAKWVINQYTINFISNEGSEVLDIIGNYHSYIVAPTDPERVGYTFDGWYSDESLLNPYIFDVMPANDLTLYAKWTANSYTITFDTEGGTPIVSITQDVDTTINEPDQPTKSGYTFNGWYLDLNDINVFTFDKMPAENLTLYAKWVVAQYTVSYVNENNEIRILITADYGSTINTPDDPERLGYSFVGWWTDETLSNPYTFDIMPAEDVMIYASWQVKQYTVTFMDGYEVIATITQDYGSTINQPIHPVKPGYQFEGWVDKDNQLFVFGVLEQDETVYTTWSYETYHLTYDLDGGSNNLNPTSYTILDEDITLLDPVKDGYLFDGWYFDESFNGMPITTISVHTLSDLQLYAKWRGGAFELTYYIVNDDTEAVNDIFLYPNEQIINVSHGFMHTIVLTSKGRIFSFGTNDYGQLGDGTYDYHEIPIDITNQFSLLENEYISRVTSGLNFSMVLTNLGRVFSWGENSNGQLGTGDMVNVLSPLDITSAFNLDDGDYITDITLGAFHGMVITNHHHVLTWGMNFYGQLGNGTMNDQLTPLDITSHFALNENETIDQVSVGYLHSAAITSDNRLFIWGDNEFGQLGNNTLDNQVIPLDISTAFTLQASESILDIILGGGNSSVLTSLGTVYMWGLNENGQLGTNDTMNQLAPINITSTFGLNENEIITHVSLGYAHSSALSSEGRLFMWGDNSFGQLGNGDFSQSLVPIDITTQFVLSENDVIEQTISQFYFSTVITSSEQIYAWGLNQFGFTGTVSNDMIVIVPSPFNSQALIRSLVRYYDSGETINNYIPTLEGYTFIGWYLDNQLTIPFDITIMPDHDVVAYGGYIPN